MIDVGVYRRPTSGLSAGETDAEDADLREGCGPASMGRNAR